MSGKDETKNDRAWKELFEKHKILEEVNKNGFFEIPSAEINKVRESRLMAKFDHKINLPEVFQQHQLSILPISRSKYIIGPFETHLKIESTPHRELIHWDFSEYLVSIDYTNLYSEISALLCAFNTGMIDHLVGQKTHYTVSGRMSTDSFEFTITNSLNKQPYKVKVKNSQCEIDAGLESENYFLIIEAKKYKVDDFLIRQLYYPYRLWSKKIRGKKVIPILMTYSNDIFSFFIYRFENDDDYNSIILESQKHYTLELEEIKQSDVSNIFSNIQLISEPDVAFPQADNFPRVVDLLSLLVERELTRDEITQNYQFDIRQTIYYTDAGRYLGLIDKNKNTDTGEITFCLTDQGKAILKQRHKFKYLDLMQKILEHQIFYRIFQLTLDRGEIPSKREICEVMSEVRLNIHETTIERRASTVRAWIDWIWRQIDD